MKVKILTYCQDLSTLYGNLLVFRTLRTGFPTAEVEVFDNASIPRARSEIQAAAEGVGGTFSALKETKHELFLRHSLMSEIDSTGPVIFLDPDIIFWKNCEDWEVKGLIAGRRLPRFIDPFSDCDTQERIHTSFLWVKSARELVAKVTPVAKKYFDANLIDPLMYMNEDRQWKRFDTLGLMYRVLPELFDAFDEANLDCYDHIFCGTHLTLLGGTHPFLARVHDKVQHGDIDELKGLWRHQEEVFAQLRPDRQE